MLGLLAHDGYTDITRASHTVARSVNTQCPSPQLAPFVLIFNVFNQVNQTGMKNLILKRNLSKKAASGQTSKFKITSILSRQCIKLKYKENYMEKYKANLLFKLSKVQREIYIKSGSKIFN